MSESRENRRGQILNLTDKNYVESCGTLEAYNFLPNAQSVPTGH
ncbi:hypothetical protein ACFLV7_14560 [Chloroflexota bacterium]